jgi:hypothetical protein
LRRVAEKFRALFNWGAAHYLLLLSAQCMKVSRATFHYQVILLYVTFFQFDLGPLLPETFISDGTCMLGGRSDGSASIHTTAASTSPSIYLGSSGWMGLKHCIVKDLKTIATGMNDSYKMILYTLLHMRMFYTYLEAEEQLKMCDKFRYVVARATLTIFRYKELDALTQPACFSVHMPFGLPIVMKLIPRHLTLNVAPSRVDTTQGVVKGPFL